MSEEEQPNSHADASSPDAAMSPTGGNGANSNIVTEGDAKPFVITLPDDPSSGNDWYLWAGVLALLTLVAFWPAIQGAYLWDDDHHITLNLTVSGLLHIWLPPIGTVQYYPLSYTLFWIQDHLWGGSASATAGFHVVNLLLHAGGAVVLWRAFRRLGLPAAWVAAAAWAVHPLQAESVCWISELKNVLSGVLVFSSLLFFLEFIDLPDPDSGKLIGKLTSPWQAYAISLGFFVLAMFAKTVACALAPALLVVLWWKRKWNSHRGVALVPYFVIGAVLSLFTAHRETDPQGTVEATGPEWHLKIVQRFLVAGRGFWFYIAKIFLPTHLSFNYPRIVPNLSDITQWLLLLAAVLLFAVLFALREKIGRGPLAAALCYALALFPSLGFVNVYPFRYSFVADHFQYLAGVPVIALVVVGVARLVHRIAGNADSSKPAMWQAVLPAVLMVVLAGASWTRAQMFFDGDTLWADVLAKNPMSWMAAYNLGVAQTGESQPYIDGANQAAKANDRATWQEQETAALDFLDSAQQNLKKVLDNPAAPEATHYLSHNQLGNAGLLRAELPGADAVSILSQAESEARQAIAGEQKNQAVRADPGPFYTMGVIKLSEADYLQKWLRDDGTTRPVVQTEPSEDAQTQPAETTDATSAATTHPTLAMPVATQSATTRMATTRPATPAEQQVIHLLEQAGDYFSQAIDLAVKAAQRPNLQAVSRKTLAMSAYQHGNADFSLAGISQHRRDVKSMLQHNRDAISYYLASLQLNDRNSMAHFRVAKCLEQVGHIDEAIYHLRAAVEYAPNHRMAGAYDEIGFIIASSHPTLNQMLIARQCFVDALKIDPNDQEAAKYLEMAEIALKNAKPATEPSTQSTTQPGTEPSTAPATATTQP
ncbi:MAG: hypothetical protein M3O30_00470 [Planctomycetota bacterium]|nr:hypothetical protein [Planctomycetota bacterium]